MLTTGGEQIGLIDLEKLADDNKRGSSSNEDSAPSDTQVNEQGSTILEVSDQEALDAETSETEDVDLTPGLTEVGDVEDTLNAIVEGQVVGSWIEFWAWLMGEAGEDFINNLDKVKAKLLAFIGILEKSVKVLKAIVDFVATVAGYLLDMASTAVALAKALLSFIKQLLKAILKLMEIPLLKAEAKFATFELFTGLDIKDMDIMGPKVNQMLTDMTTKWMNRPVAEDTMCALAFLPIAIPKEAAEAISYSVKFKDLLLKLFGDTKDEFTPPKGYTAGDANSLAEILEDFARNYKPVVVFFPEDRKKHEVATDIAELILASVGEDLPAEIVAAYGRVVEAEGFLAEKAFSADPKTQTNNIPGMLEYRAREHPKDVKCIFETNFRNDKYRYLSCVYKVSNNEGITEVTNLFCDPVFRVFKAVLGTPTILADAQAYGEILISYRYWRSKVKMWPRNIRDSEKDLMTAMDKLMEAFFGDSWEDLVTRYTPPSEKIILMVLVGNALQTAKAKLGFKPVDAYKKQIKKITGVEYRTRSAVNTNIPLFPNEITIDTVKENDVLVFFMEDSSCAYPSVDFITEGVSGIAAAGSLISADRLTPGIIEAYNNTVTAITYVKSSLDEGIKPRWYGIATPPGANSWTSSKLINTILPEEASKGIDAFFGMLDDTEELLDSWGENISDAKKKLEAVMENIDRYFRLVQKIIDKVKALIESLSLTQLPTVYTAIWKGSSTDIPGILSTALNEKQWLNSTYGGIIIFMTGSALGIAAKSYVAYNDNTRKFESFQEQMATLAGNGPTWGDISQRAKETREELEGLEKDIKIDFKEVVGGLFSNTVHFGSIESVNDISDITSFLIEASEKNYNRVSSRTDSAVVENTYIYHKKSGE